MGGFDVSAVPSDENGNVDMGALKSLLTDEVAALTLTMPTTLGLFDPQMEEISRLVHERGALLCGDGANMNSLIGRVKFGDLGFDCVQLNLHKSFGTPHGGGGPGAGPVSVKENLADFLPSPIVVKTGDSYKFVKPIKSIGRIGAAYGNFGVMVGLRGSDIVTVPLSEVGGKQRLVQPDDPLLAAARSVGTTFGDT
jgi:glycine dehydrogenase subunit 2